MALTTCPDCERDVSTLAQACPHCGRPVDQTEPVMDETMTAVAAGKRIACPDGNCTGIIKENGQCGTCGLHHMWEDEEDRWDQRTRAHEKPLSPQIKCPKCSSTQITAQKKGFGLGKSVLGLAVIGPIGLLGGVVGAGKVKVTCISCGHSWAAGS